MKNKVSYFYNPEISKFTYGKLHLMDPRRISMTNSLIIGYGIYKELDVYQSSEATKEELCQFHDPEYINYISTYISKKQMDMYKMLGQKTPEISESIKNDFSKKAQFGIDIQADCPGFDGLYTFSQLSTGGSIDAAYSIIHQTADVAINYGGGLHHAKKREAYGFCYVNDIVVCILELLKVYVRVLYVDIDVHHGDGVEEAFYCTNRVMTLSFHEYGDDFFPGTGNYDELGEGDGKYHSINVPLKSGMDDDSYRELFQAIVSRVIESYRPDVVVLQTGADSLSQDKIGHFNLSIRGHAECVKYIRNFGLPLIILGGGGYTITNVSKCWVYETGCILGKDLDGPIPIDDEFYALYGQDPQLHFEPIQSENKNTPESLNNLRAQIYETLRNVEHAPGFQFHQVPKVFTYTDQDSMSEEEEYEIKRKRPSQMNKASIFMSEQ